MDLALRAFAAEAREAGLARVGGGALGMTVALAPNRSVASGARSISKADDATGGAPGAGGTVPTKTVGCKAGRAASRFIATRPAAPRESTAAAMATIHAARRLEGSAALASPTMGGMPSDLSVDCARTVDRKST